MYSLNSNLILGFHGCDESVRDELLNSDSFSMKKKDNAYDWLGNGYYFWENNLYRATAFAKEVKDNPSRYKTTINKPSAVGAIINLGRCLDLLDQKHTNLLKDYFSIFEKSYKLNGKPLPLNKKGADSDDLLIRNLDCRVINNFRAFVSSEHGIEYDSVRGVFIEGDELYPTAGFRDKNHIQICIINKDCIKGFFKPLKQNN